MSNVHNVLCTCFETMHIFLNIIVIGTFQTSALSLKSMDTGNPSVDLAEIEQIVKERMVCLHHVFKIV